MTGKQLDDEYYENKINYLLNKNSDKPYLKGFKNWAKPNHSLRTVYNYILYIVSFLDYTKKNITEIELDDWADYADAQSKLSSSNQIAKYSAVKAFAKYLTASKKIPSNFMQDANRPKYIETQKTKEKREKGFLAPRETQQVLRNVEIGVGNERALWLQNEYRSRDMSIFMLFLTTGIRSSALRNMDIDDINFEENTIRVTDKGNKANTHGIPEETKTVLQKWLYKREELLTKAGKTEEKALFISNRKLRLSNYAIYSIVKKYSQSIGGKNITPHKLRATYGTLLYARTHDIELVRQQMNHNSVTTTQRYIRGNEKANQKKAANIMGDIVSSSKRRETGSLTEED